MRLLQHTSVHSALEFDREGIVHSAINLQYGIPKNARDLRTACARSQGYVNTVTKILDKPRTGWTIQERNIEPQYRETIGAHLVKVALGVWYLIEGLMRWHKNRGEAPSPELQNLYLQIHLRLHLVRKGFFHDFSEWGEHHDYRPSDIPKEEKRRRELHAVEEYSRVFGDDYPRSVFLTLKDKTYENEVLDNIDKVDPAIMALNYQRDLPGAEVSEFFVSSFERITFPLMREVLEMLIRYRDDYPQDVFLQYLHLLRLGGNLSEWRRVMDALQ